MTRSGPSESRTVLWVGLLVVGLHALLYGRYLPYDGTHIGHDYGYFLPDLLAGAYWFHENGPWSIPWFTPAFCGGVPFYAHPSCGYFSFPQALAILVGPIVAVKGTLVVFTALGFLGTHLLLRRTFALSLVASLFGATIFAWNGFFTARMLTGHLFFHAQMLVPLAAWWVTRPVPEERRWRRLAHDTTCAALVFAYSFQAGSFYGLVPAGLSCAALVLLAALRGGRLAQGCARLGGACGLAVLLCLSKLSAGLAFIASSPRSGYPLPGAANPLGAVWAVIQGSFVFPSAELGRWLFVNERWKLDLHEWDFEVTWVAGALIVLGAWSLRRRWRDVVSGRRRRLVLAMLAVVLLLPIAFNTYSPGWNAWLKELPVVQNSSSLVRWFAAYVPVFSVFAALALERVVDDPLRRARVAFAAGALAVATHAAHDRSFYATQPYDPTRVAQAFADLRRTGHVPPIERCTLRLGSDGHADRRPGVNDGLVDGASPIASYEPIFGYDLEWLPLGTLHQGPADELRDGRFNFKNPTGYLFPAENGCGPGAHFREDQETQLQALLHYRAIEFQKSSRQELAERINLVALAGVLSVLVLGTAGALRRALRS